MFEENNIFYACFRSALPEIICHAIICPSEIKGAPKRMWVFKTGATGKPFDMSK